MGDAVPEMGQLRIEGASSSLYWQPAQGDLLYPVGLAGEWLQNVRPPAQWTGSEVRGDGSRVYRLEGGTGRWRCCRWTMGRGNGLVLEVRPERATMAWDGAAGRAGGGRTLWTSTSYRPSGLGVGWGIWRAKWR